jgi:transcriptional regulator with XRE-family HTH domain
MATEQSSSFAAQLRRYREAAGLTQEQLAEQAGLATAAISALERGVRQRPYAHTLGALAAALNLTDIQRVDFMGASRKKPQLASVTNVGQAATSLPNPLTAMLGRDRELAAINELLLGGNTTAVCCWCWTILNSC